VPSRLYFVISVSMVGLSSPNLWSAHIFGGHVGNTDLQQLSKTSQIEASLAYFVYLFCVCVSGGMLGMEPMASCILYKVLYYWSISPVLLACIFKTGSHCIARLASNSWPSWLSLSARITRVYHHLAWILTCQNCYQSRCWEKNGNYLSVSISTYPSIHPSIHPPAPRFPVCFRLNYFYTKW
jgi:hypothetical protein